MSEVEISAEIYCNWDQQAPVYRVYVDQDLLTERTYKWVNPEQFVCERIVVNLESGMHELRIQAVDSADQDKFSVKNVHINHQPAPYVNNQIIIP